MYRKESNTVTERNLLGRKVFKIVNIYWLYNHFIQNNDQYNYVK